MFIGEYQHNLDDKGRLAVPVKFREMLKQGTVVTKGLDNCLFVYPKEEWSKLANKLAKLSIAKANTRGISRLMLGGAMEVEIDKQGRVVLPDYLRKYAGLHKRAILAGLYNRVEIWDEAAWEKYKSGTEKSATDIAEALEGLGE